MILIRILEKLLIIYFSLYVIIDVLLYFYALFVFGQKSISKKKEHVCPEINCPPVTVVVPAFNEEVSIVMCVKMLLNLEYNDYTIIVVNDGSTDLTLHEMLKHFEFTSFECVYKTDQRIPTSEVRCIYSAESGKLLLIDKVNGGKADSINTAINIADGDFICTIDADSILDRKALQNVVQPLVQNSNVFVSGGQIALSNDLHIENNKVVSARMPRNILVLWQVLEYISTFMVARIGLSRINALLIMSGAFSIFRKNDLIEVGGFINRKNDHPYIVGTIGKNKQAITEDMEIVIRLWRYYLDKKRKARAVFLPGPVCWTEAPEKPNQLYKQRMRWHQGLAETLWLYRGMMFEPKYRAIGLFALPYNFFMEMLAPLIKTIAFAYIVLMITTQTYNQQWVFLFIAGTVLLYTIILSSITVIIEKWSMSYSSTNRDALRYKSVFDWTILILGGIVANFSYSFFKMFAQLHGMLNFLRRKQNWMKFERKGIKVVNQINETR